MHKSMKKSIILIAAALMLTTGAVAQKKKAVKKVDPIMAAFEQQKKAFEEANAEVTKQMNDLNTAYYAAKTAEERDSLSKEAQGLYPKYQAAMAEYMKTNPSTVLTASFIAPYASGMATNELTAAYEQLGEDAKNSEFGKSIKQELTVRENLQPGKPAPMIAKNDIDGKPFSLADLKGNIVLLDFWASWCVPCRQSNPHMMRIYDKYHDKGLKMVYVGDNDSNPNELRKAIEKDGVGREGIVHLLRGLKTIKNDKGEFAGYDKSEDVSEAYGVHTIPTKFLIDREGRLIGKVESDKWLDEQLSQLLDGKPNRDFHLEGAINGAEGDTIVLRYTAPEGVTGMAVSKVENGHFSFNGTLAGKVCQAAIIYQKDKADPRSQQYCQIYLEPSESMVMIDINDFRNPKMQGSDTQRELDAFNATVKADNDKLAELSKQYSAETDREKQQAIREAMGPYSENVKKAQMDYVKAHPGSYISCDFIFFNMGNMTHADLKAAYEALPEDVKAGERGKQIKEEVDAKERVLPGREAYVIKKADVMTGKMVDMSKMRGKYIIVDFWASWCVPCRQGNPHMVELYNKYHKKGLEMIFVGDNDDRPQDLKNAIEKDGLKKMHHVLRGVKIVSRSPFKLDKSEDISDKYAVHYLPTKYLIDKEGRIVGKFDSEELDAKLAEIFGE